MLPTKDELSHRTMENSSPLFSLLFCGSNTKEQPKVIPFKFKSGEINGNGNLQTLPIADKGIPYLHRKTCYTNYIYLNKGHKF